MGLGILKHDPDPVNGWNMLLTVFLFFISSYRKRSVPFLKNKNKKSKRWLKWRDSLWKRGEWECPLSTRGGERRRRKGLRGLGGRWAEGHFHNNDGGRESLGLNPDLTYVWFREKGILDNS